MPELPEVETTRRGIEPHVVDQRIVEVTVREKRLRYPVPARLVKELPGQAIRAVMRRGKYLLMRCDKGTVIVHLGMSGSLLVVRVTSPPAQHDHVDIVLRNGTCLRLHDPRRFGAVLWTTRDPLLHRLLKHLGPEPLAMAFDGNYLFARSRGRQVAIKQFIMDSRIVVGVGNIYANEALFLAGIRPSHAAGRVSLTRYARLAQAIKEVLGEAINQGGTTLRDFFNSEGSPGYFRQHLCVYERAGAPCRNCGSEIFEARLGQRSTYYCRRCQR